MRGGGVVRSRYICLEIHKIAPFIKSTQDRLVRLSACLYSCHGHVCRLVVVCLVGNGRKTYTKPVNQYGEFVNTFVASKDCCSAFLA